jgi:hypothetical protein
MGRPATESAKIDRAELEKLMRLYPSEQEAADWFDVTIKTLMRFIRKEFGSSFVQLREKSFTRTKVAIKRSQLEKAMKGDNTMLIWVGKQYLGQRDKNSHEHSGPDGNPIETKNTTTLTDQQLNERIAKLTGGGSA